MKKITTTQEIKDLKAIIKIQEGVINAKEDENKVLGNIIDKNWSTTDEYLRWIVYYKHIERYTLRLEKQLEEHIKERNEVTRAYNGLAELGKFAGDLGIDIQKHRENLPENQNKYDFEQKHTLLESGKVKHSYKLKPVQKSLLTKLKANNIDKKQEDMLTSLMLDDNIDQAVENKEKFLKRQKHKKDLYNGKLSRKEIGDNMFLDDHVEDKERELFKAKSIRKKHKHTVSKKKKRLKTKKDLPY